MKKRISLIAAFIGTLVMPLCFLNNGFIKANAALNYEGEVNLGAKVVFDSTSASATKYLSVALPTTTNNGTNFFVRLKNNSNSAKDVYFTLENNNGHYSTIKPNGKYILYDEMGENASSITNTTGGYFTLPSLFNGYLSVTNLNLGDDSNWTQTVTSKNIAILNTFYFGISTQNNATSLSIGDIFTTDLMNLDVSTLTETTFAQAFTVKDSASGVTITRMPATDFDLNHDMKGGAMVSIQYLSTDTSVYWNIYPENPSLDGEGIYMRMKNGWAYEYWLQFYILGTNSHRMSLKTSASTYTYNLQGTGKTEVLSRNFGSYFYLTGGFDGYIYIPFSSLMDDSSWSGNTANPTMDYTSVYCLTFGLSGYYDYNSVTMFGDVFTTESIIFDGSKYSPTSFANRFAPDQYGNGQYANISRLSGYAEEVTYDYATVTGYKDAEVVGGGVVSLTQTETDITTSLTINLAKNFTGANAFAIRIKNYSYDYPYYLKVKDALGRVVSPQGSNLGNIYYLTDDGTLTANGWGGNVVYVKIPTAFEGLMIIPLDSLCGASSLNLANIASFEFFMSTKYDYGFNVAFGDVGYINSSMEYHTLLDVSELSQEDWESTFTLTNNPDNGGLTRLNEAKTCPWIGDVKVLNSLVFASDEDMAKEIITDENDNPLTYTREENGVKVTPGEYEVGHANGPYSCLALVNNSIFDDRLTMSYDSFGDAKGMTLYVKNLSSREIGVSFGFDQATTRGGVQRWTLIGYPSMYYAYDVTKDAEYMFYFKGDHFQIPHGFEGYIRLPFSSFGIPDWCTSNEELAISRFTGNVYLATDNRSFAGLSYLVKNVGVYFKDTDCGSLFNNENTIKANMGF